MNTHKIVPKGWGEEEWIVNNDLYCGKILRFQKGKRCSYHYHKIKNETFYLSKGRIEVSLGRVDYVLEKFQMKVGDSLDIPVGLVHSVLALEDSEIIEFSTHHEDSDSYRVIKGD
jgi:quercetin dioxygenase-like cupin family protein